MTAPAPALRDRIRTALRLSFLWRASTRHPWVVLALAAIILPWFAVEALRLKLEPRIDLLSPSDPLALAERARHAAFGPDFRILVGLTRDYRGGGVLQEDSLRALHDLHRALEELPGITRAASLVNAPALVSSAAAPAGAPLWSGAGPGAGAALFEKLKASALQRYMYLSALWSLAPIYLETDPAMPEADLVREIQRLALDVEARHPGAGRVLVVGPAVVESALAGHVFEDLSRLVPFAIGVVALGLLIVVRSGRLLLVALVHCLALLAVVLGGMAAIGWNVNLVSVLAPVVLIPIGVADLLHLFIRLRSGVHADPGAPEDDGGVRAAYGRLEGAMIGTTATTALGFLGFLIPPVDAIRQFGLTMSAGSVAALLITFTVDAALLGLLWRPRAGTGVAARRRGRAVERGLLALAVSPPLLRRSARAVAVAGAVVAVAGVVALMKLRIEDTWIENFDAGSRIARDTRAFEEVFLGTNLLALVVDTDGAGRDAQPAAIDQVNSMTTSFSFLRGARGGLSATLLARSLDPAQGRPWDAWPSPSPEQLRTALALWEERGPGLPRPGMLVEGDLGRFQVLVFVLNQPYRRLSEVVEEIRTRAVALAPPGVTIRVGGDLVANIRMVRLAVNGQGLALAALLAVMTIVLVGFTRSPRAGVWMILPMVLAILATYAVLVGAGIPYGVAVSMFPTLVLGSAVDFAIHLRAAIVGCRRASRTRWARELAIVVRGILLNGVLWTAGFAVLSLSALPPNRSLGLMCSTVFALATAASLGLLPSLALAAQRELGRGATTAPGP